MADRRARGERRPETFDFLGFTHYCRKTRTGGFGLGRKTDSEAGYPHLETAQGAPPRADARRRPRDGAMVGEGGQRMAELLRRADQFPGPWRLRTASGVYLAQDLASAVPADTHDDSRCSPPRRGAILAPCAGQAPLACRAVCRQPPKVGAVCVNAHVRICAGGPGQPGSLPRRCAVMRTCGSACSSRRPPATSSCCCAARPASVRPGACRGGLFRRYSG